VEPFFPGGFSHFLMKRYNFCVRVPFLCLISGLLGMGVFAKRGWLDWRRMVRNNHEMVSKVESLKQQHEELEKQIKALETSPFAQEQAVRQYLGYLRKEEIVIELP
jgi:cell division protein FtsB